MFNAYLQDLHAVAQRGDAREESFYSALERLLVAFADDAGHDEAAVTTLPKQTEAGNPDFRVWDGQQHVVGYVEAKKPGTDLNAVEQSEQLRRYRETFPNVILTDFYSFRLYRDGARIQTVKLGGEVISRRLGHAAPAENTEAMRQLLGQFFAFSQPKTASAEELARELAERTRFLRFVISEELARGGDAKATKRLRGFYTAFSRYLIAGLTEAQFADLYAQTITYGLFAARSRADADAFRRTTASSFIPPTIGILRDVFEFVSLGQAPKQVEVIVDDLAGVLRVADIGGILARYFETGRGDDPILHFYETFLAAYDPGLRERRGVYYTPEPVVGYIVRSLHHLLQSVFGKGDGLADPSVTVLDPAAGTLTFIVEAFRQALDAAGHYGAGAASKLVEGHLLENFYAFELMMAPYAIGHLKMGYVLGDLGHDLGQRRFKLYLTNTLEMEDIQQTDLPGMDTLSEESRAAGRVKKDQPILAVLGNPPYSGHSYNPSEKPAEVKKGSTYVAGWEADYDGTARPVEKTARSTRTRKQPTFIGAKLQDYYFVDGESLTEQGERNTKWLQDDYVKFIRFAQWQVEQHGQGVVAFITNHSFLDNPTFRGMRQALMRAFDHVYVFDLHGNSLKKERAPDGSRDDNVFDIMQGVSISFFVKHDGLEKTVRRADLFGTRDAKYDWLKTHDLTSTEWTTIEPQAPFYFFTERDYDLEAEYDRFVQVTELFPVHSVGVVTARDGFVIDTDEKALRRRIETFRDRNLPDDYVREALSLRDNRDWKMEAKRKLIQEDDDWKDKFKRILYRQFDVRPIFYHYHAIDFGREDVMRHMLAGDNLALITVRKSPSVNVYRYAFVTEHMISNGAIRSDNQSIDYLFPLYLYPEAKKRDLFSAQEDEGGARVPNLDAALYDGLAAAYGTRPTPEDVLHYVYAVLYAPAYRTTYAAFLKTDFPKVPFPEDPDLFHDLAAHGATLVDLHLMRSARLSPPMARFEGEGSDRVAKPKRVGRNYVAEEARVYINKDGQFFGPIPEDVWQYQVGGYQVLDKWLYDRREQVLSYEEIRHYCRMVTALHATMQVQDAIDAIYPGVEEHLLSHAALLAASAEA